MRAGPEAAESDGAGDAPSITAGRSAAGLLLTILGEYLLPAEGRGAWTSAFVTALADLGVEEKAARQALMRTADRGLIRSEKFGRRVQWQLTDAGTALLADGSARIYQPPGSAADWDGSWLLVLARVPDADRRARHRLQSRLGWAGLGKLAAGTWISPHPERAAEVREVLAGVPIDARLQLFVGRWADDRDPAELVASAWDLSSIRRYHEWFIAEFQRPEPASGAELLSRQIELVHFWRRSLLIDPLLPAQLLPADWPGLRAGEVFRQCHGRWRPGADRRWQQLLDVG